MYKYHVVCDDVFDGSRYLEVHVDECGEDGEIIACQRTRSRVSRMRVLSNLTQFSHFNPEKARNAAKTEASGLKTADSRRCSPDFQGIGDQINDFGFGVTASDPEELDELGAVADEVPRSWVVDFTQSMARRLRTAIRRHQRKHLVEVDI